MPKSINSVTLRKYNPPPRPSDPPSYRSLCQTIFVLYSKPHAAKTRKPSGNRAFGTQRYMCADGAAISETGNERISSTERVSYRARRRCSGAILPVRLANRQGGSASIVPNRCPPANSRRLAPPVRVDGIDAARLCHPDNGSEET